MNPYIISAISEVTETQRSQTNPCRQDLRRDDDLVDKDSLYSREILNGIVHVLQLCIEWSKRHPGKFVVKNEEGTNEWNIECNDVVEYVNELLFQKHKDPTLNARVWQAMYYEIPEKLYLNDTSESHAIIFKRTASQQRICIAAFVAMRCVENGSFNVSVSPDDRGYQVPPSLSTLQRVQLDYDNIFIRDYVGQMSEYKRPLTVDEFCTLPCGSTFIMYDIQPLAEVMLPLSNEDQHEMMQSKKLMPHWQAEQVALMKMIDTHFQKTHYTQYYTTEKGPSVLKDIYAAAMLEASCKFVMTVHTDNPYETHQFWCRNLTEAHGPHTSVTSYHNFSRYLDELWAMHMEQKEEDNLLEYLILIEQAIKSMNNLQNFTDEERSMLRLKHKPLFNMFAKMKAFVDWHRNENK